MYTLGRKRKTEYTHTYTLPYRLLKTLLQIKYQAHIKLLTIYRLIKIHIFFKPNQERFSAYNPIKVLYVAYSMWFITSD